MKSSSLLPPSRRDFVEAGPLLDEHPASQTPLEEAIDRMGNAAEYLERVRAERGLWEVDDNGRIRWVPPDGPVAPEHEPVELADE